MTKEQLEKYYCTIQADKKAGGGLHVVRFEPEY